MKNEKEKTNEVERPPATGTASSPAAPLSRVSVRLSVDENGEDRIAISSIDAIAPEDTDEKLQGDLNEAEFESLSLAATLMIRLGILTPRQAFEQERIDRRRSLGRTRRLNTPKAIVKEIERTVVAIADGRLDPKQGKTLLYGLQTLLVAHRVAAEAEHAENSRGRGDPRELTA